MLRAKECNYSVTVKTITKSGSREDLFAGYRNIIEALQDVADWQRMDEQEGYHRYGWLISYTIKDLHTGERYTITKKPGESPEISYQA